MAKRPKPQPKEPKPRKPRKKVTTPSKNFASKVGNGTSTFLAPSGAIDGRSLAARRFQELTFNLTSDMGGIAALSTVQQQLAKRFAGSCVVAELAEAELVKTGKIDAGAYSTLINSQNRLAASIGIRRAVIDATPTLEQYLNARATGSPGKGDEDEGDKTGATNEKRPSAQA